METEANILGRPLSDAEAVIAATKPLDDLPIPRLLIKSLTEKGLRVVGDLSAAPLQTLALGPVQLRRVRQALLLALAGDNASVRLEAASLAELPERVCELMGHLDERRRAAIEKAYGLWDGYPVQRLQISKTLGLAYPTVRNDIERGTADLRRLLKPESEEFKRALRAIYLKLLAAQQGMAGFQEWQDPASTLYRDQETACAAFAFLCRVTGTKPELLVTLGVDRVCYDGMPSKYRHDQIVDAAKTALLNIERPMPLDELARLLQNQDHIAASPQFLRRCLELSRELGLETSGAAGLRSWSYFDAHSLHGMAHAALAAIGKPAHHDDIARIVDALYPHRAPVNRTSLYTMLTIHKEEFILARHGGVFGLPEWHIEGVSNLKDFLTDFLRLRGGKAKRQDLMTAAKKKGYKVGSVSSVLHIHKELFRRLEWGTWGLAV
jgi:hypothetical protein